MPDNHGSASANPIAHEMHHKIRPLWRWCIGVVSLMGIILILISYEVRRDINVFYHPGSGSTVQIEVLDAIAVILAAYFLIVAIFGRWWPFNFFKRG